MAFLVYPANVYPANSSNSEEQVQNSIDHPPGEAEGQEHKRADETLLARENRGSGESSFNPGGSKLTLG